MKTERPSCACHGQKIVFDCQKWPGCACPAGTTRDDCPGHSKPCPQCTAVDEKEAA